MVSFIYQVKERYFIRCLCVGWCSWFSWFLAFSHVWHFPLWIKSDAMTTTSAKCFLRFFFLHTLFISSFVEINWPLNNIPFYRFYFYTLNHLFIQLLVMGISIKLLYERKMKITSNELIMRICHFNIRLTLTNKFHEIEK